MRFFLGLCNRIIDDTLSQLVEDNEVLDQSSDSVKTTSLLPGQVGKSRVYSLTGPELTRYIKQEKIYEIFYELEYDDQIHEQLKEMQSWMEKLKDDLLTKERWDETRIAGFKVFVDELLSDWNEVTRTPLTPKCHLLLHVLPFVKNFGYLGRYNESQLESYHGQFFHIQSTFHFNQNNNTGEQLRRTLADMTLKAIVNCQ